MRNLYVAVGLALCSTGVLAADFGVGVTAKSDDGIIYVPIDISKSFRIEPSVRYASSENATPDSSSDFVRETDALEVGIGVFGLKQVTDVARLYFGARVAYVEIEDGFYSRTAHRIDIQNTEQDGYRVGPTVGFEYLFGQHFSVGGEASYTFIDVEGETTDVTRSPGFTSINRSDVESNSDGTETRLIFRYMF